MADACFTASVKLIQTSNQINDMGNIDVTVHVQLWSVGKDTMGKIPLTLISMHGQSWRGLHFLKSFRQCMRLSTSRLLIAYTVT